MKRLISVFTRVSVQFLSSLLLLGRTLRCEYFVLSLDFQRIGSASFKTEERFVKAFCRQLKKKGLKAGMPDSVLNEVDPDYKTFQSVILAGVTDIKNLKRRLQPNEEHKFNSPWNIAADFNVDMSLSADRKSVV